MAGYDHLRTIHEQPDKILRVTVGNEGLQPAKLVADKGQVISLCVTSTLAGTDRLSIKGYDTVGLVDLDPEGNETRVTFVADKPGAGFPMLLESSEQVLRQLVVTGAHLEEEEL